MAKSKSAPSTHGIYAIQRRGSDEFYVGSAVNIAQRWREHRSKLDRGIHNSSHMQNVWNKHGDVFDFVILEHVTDKVKLIEQEQAWLDKLSPVYNTLKVAGSRLGFKQSEEARAKISAARTGKKHTPESIAKMSEAKSGKKKSTEHCANISAAMMGNTRCLRVRHGNEVRARMSAASMGIHSKLNEAMVIDIFRSTGPLRVAAALHGISLTNVSRIRRSRIWTHITAGVV